MHVGVVPLAHTSSGHRYAGYRGLAYFRNEEQNMTEQRDQARDKFRSRVKELRHVPAKHLKANPKNWRTHDSIQQDAFNAVLEQVGFAGAVIAYENDDDELVIIDGHMRTEHADIEKVPVLILDVSEEEADLLLATYDPIGTMAESDAERLGELLQGVSASEASLVTLLEDIDEQFGLHELTLPRQETDADYVENPLEAIAATEDPNTIAERTMATEGLKPFILYVSVSKIEVVREKVAFLADKWEYDNATDVVMKLIDEGYEANK